MKYVIFVVMVFVNASSLWSQEDSVKDSSLGSDSSQFACSLLEGLLANNRSIQSYDVVVKQKVFYDKPGVRAASLERTSRQIFSSTMKKHLIAAKEIRESTSQADDAVSAPPSVSIYGAILGEGPDYFFSNEIMKGTRRMTSLGNVKQMLQWPHEESTGFVYYPCTRNLENAETKLWEQYMLPAGGAVGQMISDDRASIKLTVASPDAMRNPDSDVVEYSWTFDLSSVVPTERRATIVNPTSKRRIRKERETFEWQEIEGVMVPKLIRGEKLKSFRNETGNVERYVVHSDTEFVWLSLNAKMKKEDFSQDRMDTRKSLGKLIEVEK